MRGFAGAAAALLACIALVGCTSTPQRPVPAPTSDSATTPAVATPTSATSQEPTASGSVAAPGVGVLILIEQSHRLPPEAEPPPPGQALDAYEPQVRDRIVRIFADHDVAIETANSMPTGYVLVVTRRGSDPDAVQQVLTDLRAYQPVLDASVEAS